MRSKDRRVHSISVRVSLIILTTVHMVYTYRTVKISSHQKIINNNDVGKKES